MSGVSRSTLRSSLWVWACSMLTNPHSRCSRSSAIWNPSGATPSARMRNASASASVASSASQTSRVSISPRSGAAPNRAAFSQTVAVTDWCPVSMVSISKVMMKLP